ncbi:MAG: hypothetical protein ACLFUM_05835 [Spirochaetaceae bacterium]
MANKKTQELMDEVRRYLNQDPTLSDPSKIVISAQRSGGLFAKRTKITLEGRAQNEAEARAIGEMVGAKLGDGVDVENKITAGSS